MAKTFFIVVPFFVGTTMKFGKGKGDGPAPGVLERFEEGKSQLEQRANIVRQGLIRCGVRVVPLGTEEIVELFYKIFNPSDVGRNIKLTR